MTWHVQYRIARQSPGDPTPHYDTFDVAIEPEETVLDGIERIWAQQDRSLVFRHACHHASCGSCGLRVNGVEKLSCIAYIKDLTKDGGTLTVEPLRHFSLISDLAVDVAPMFEKMHMVGMPITRQSAPLGQPGDFNRFENCLECGLCISACPLTETNPKYLGPAALAAAERLISEPRGADIPALMTLVDGEHGCWRCHTAFECSEVCPNHVNPAASIMALRQRLLFERLKGLFGQTSLRPAKGGVR